MKKLPNKLRSYNETARVIKKILFSNKGNDIRVLEHLLSYADNQFGQQVEGRDYREGADGQRITNILLNVSTGIINHYASNHSQSRIILDNKFFPHLERSLNILRPWMVIMDSDASNQSNSLNLGQTDYFLKLSSRVERGMALVTMNRNKFDAAEGYCHCYLVDARRLRLKGEDKTTSIYVELRQRQDDFSGAVTFVEEAYNVVVIAYHCVHHQVQEAAGMLTGCLIDKGDLLNAKRFA
jgi:hypothetical protein